MIGYCAEHKDQRKAAFLAAITTDCPYCRIAELEQQLAERDGEIALLRKQSVGWVQVFDENAALRAEVERYRELLTEGLNFGKVLVATENMKAVYSWVKKVRNGLEG